MKSVNEYRDEQARDKCSNFQFMELSQHEKDQAYFCMGFDSAMAYQNERVEKLVEAVKEASKYANMDDVNGIAGLICDEALAEFNGD